MKNLQQPGECLIEGKKKKPTRILIVELWGNLKTTAYISGIGAEYIREQNGSNSQRILVVLSVLLLPERPIQRTCLYFNYY